MLVLVAQVLAGFEFQAVFLKGFDKLPEPAKALKVVSLVLLALALALLMMPVAFHRIVEEGNDTIRFNRLITRAIFPALLPFALGMGIDVFIAAEKVGSRAFGIALGAGIALLALFCWYLLEGYMKAKQGHHGPEEESMKPEGTPLEEKITQLLTETRVVIPGAQALLGFQFAVMLNESFDKLSPSLKQLHLVSLTIVAISAILLLMPAAYHRIVEMGENTERFHSFASRVLLAAMAILALGLSADFVVVVEKVFHSPSLAMAGGLAMLALYYGTWFGYTLLRKRQENPTDRRMPQPATR